MDSMTFFTSDFCDAFFPQTKENVRDCWDILIYGDRKQNTGA